MPANMIRYSATRHELALVEDIEEIGFGELYNLRYDKDEQPMRVVEITERTKLFLKFMRQLEAANRLIIHDSEPSLLEYRAITRHGHECLKKMKF